MKEIGMVFNAGMVNAILDGRKTQTRRPVQFKPRDPGLNLNYSGLELGHYRSGTPLSRWVLRSRGGMGFWNDRTYPAKCPFGQPGDRIWVRETFATLGNEDGCPIDWNDKLVKGGGPEAARIYRASCDQKPGDYRLWSIPDDAFWKPHTDDMKYEGSWTPPIYMPRWASRITLEIMDVRVERLQDISEADARAEGITDSGCLSCGKTEPCGCSEPKPCAADAFAHLWQTTYGEDNWFSNPWVWVIEFREVK